MHSCGVFKIFSRGVLSCLVMDTEFCHITKGKLNDCYIHITHKKYTNDKHYFKARVEYIFHSWRNYLYI